MGSGSIVLGIHSTTGACQNHGFRHARATAQHQEGQMIPRRCVRPTMENLRPTRRRPSLDNMLVQEFTKNQRELDWQHDVQIVFDIYRGPTETALTVRKGIRPTLKSLF